MQKHCGHRVVALRLSCACLCVSLSFVLALVGCRSEPSDEETVHEVEITVIEDNLAPEVTSKSEVGAEPELEAEEEPGTDVVTDPEASVEPTGESPAYPYTPWDSELAPEYVHVVGYSQIASIPKPGTAIYAPLDELGRAGQVSACVTYPMMEKGRARERKNLSGVSPSGWGHNSEVDIELSDGSFYHGLFWNRSHLLAKSLGGADVVENLVCGTRMQNVGSNRGGKEGGMAYCENLARMWLDDYPDGWLAYVVTPVYEGDELVCRSVFVDMLSSDGEMDVRIEVFNAAKGYVIDYATGEFWPADAS